MKSRFLFLFLFICGTLSVNAQGKFLGKPIKSINLSASHDLDLLESMDNTYFTDAMKDKSFDPILLEQFSDADVESMVCENPNLSLGIALELPRNFEWQLGANAIISRYDGISYKSDGSQWNNNYANFSTTADEYGLETAILKRLPLVPFRNRLGNSPINLLVGAGTNIGAIVNHRLYAYGSNYPMIEDYTYTNITQLEEDLDKGVTEDLEPIETFDGTKKLNGGISQRVYGQAGISFTFVRRLEIGMQAKYGIGYRAIKGADTKKTSLRSFGLTMRWNFM